MILALSLGDNSSCGLVPVRLIFGKIRWVFHLPNIMIQGPTLQALHWRLFHWQQLQLGLPHLMNDERFLGLYPTILSIA